MFGRAVGT